MSDAALGFKVRAGGGLQYGLGEVKPSRKGLDTSSYSVRPYKATPGSHGSARRRGSRRGPRVPTGTYTECQQTQSERRTAR